MTRFKIALILIFCTTSFYSIGQKDDCVKNVEKVYKLWTKEVKENYNNGIYLKYNYELVVDNKGKLDKTTSIMEVMSDKDNSIFYTKNLSVYQDKKYTVSVLDDKKIIVINGYAGDAYKAKKIDHFELIKDTVFHHLKTKECEEVSINGKNYKKIILVGNSTANKIFKIKTLEFLVDESLNRIKKIKVKYLDGHRFYSMQIDIMDEKLNYQMTNIKKKALSNVLTDSGKLLSKYSGYKLIDNRN